MDDSGVKTLTMGAAHCSRARRLLASKASINPKDDAFFHKKKTVSKHEIVCQRSISQRHYLALLELIYVKRPFSVFLLLLVSDYYATTIKQM